MGQAKNRGSFEQRKTQSIELARLQAITDAKQRMIKEGIRPRGKSHLNLLIAASIAMGVIGVDKDDH